MQRSSNSTRLPPGLIHLCLCCCLVLLAGCGSGSDLGETTAVEGNVTIDGKPVDNGQIVFENADPEAPPPRTTVIKISNGHYVSGMLPTGKYKVAIKPLQPGQTWNVPTKYHDSSTSGLTAEFESGDSVTKNFELTP